MKLVIHPLERPAHCLAGLCTCEWPMLAPRYLLVDPVVLSIRRVRGLGYSDIVVLHSFTGISTVSGDHTPPNNYCLCSCIYGNLCFQTRPSRMWLVEYSTNFPFSDVLSEDDSTPAAVCLCTYSCARNMVSLQPC